MPVPPRILCLLDLQGYGRGVLAGVVARAQALAWDCRVECWGEGTGWDPRRLRDFTGAVAAVRTPAELEALSASGIAAVNVCAAGPGLVLPSVLPDDQAAGALAARHLSELGFDHLALLGDPALVSTRERLAGVRAEIQRRAADGHRVTCDAHDDVTAAVAALTGAGAPIGVVALDDALARRLASACAAAGLRIPESLALVGCDDDQLLCELTAPPLSSVALPLRRIGVEAANLLQHLLDGGQPPAQPLRLEPEGVTARRSTAITAIDDPVLDAALRTIRSRACEGLSASDVVAAVGGGRSTLEKRFHARLGTSIGVQLRRARIDAAKALLAGTDLELKQVARRAGFSDAKQFGATFTRDVGETPLAWRRAHRG